ncbi:MAG TPA: 2-aminoethylphosphonate--pyruvate transaminase [Candidatus Ozemobacteraceae bacterium]|nr:2-aminoethylphosphonate--pyruvate transaminase [Candidatus Ozemobacteraceae bacterium]
MIERRILLNPGPATTTDTVKMAQVVPDICPREQEFGTLVDSIAKDLVTFAGGDSEYSCVPFGGSGTAGMEAVITSVVPPDTTMLVINNGAYGERMANIAAAYKIDCVQLPCEWSHVPRLDDLRQMLEKHPEVSTVAMVHHETTSGLLNPLNAVGTLVKSFKKLFIVDAISSFAGIPLNVKNDHIDFMVSTSNKCLQGMAGICFAIGRTTEILKLKAYPRRNFYLSLYDQYEFFSTTLQMRFTPPVQTMYALRKAIDELLEEGLQNRIARYTQNWKVLRKGLESLGLKILTRPEEESHLLITIHYPELPGFQFDRLHDELYQQGFTIYPGKIGAVNTFRLAVMGAIDETDVRRFLAALSSVLTTMKRS